MSYLFLDANSSILSADSDVVGSNHRPIVEISSILVSLPVVVSGNASISGTVGSSIVGQLPAGTAVIGSVAVLQGTNPWNISSVYGNVSGSVLAQQLGTHIASVVSSTPSSMLTGASIFGQLPAGTAVLGSIAALQGTNPWIIAPASVSGTVGASIIGQLPAGTAVLGSVATLQGTNPWIILGSVQAAVSGSVLSFQAGTNISSIVSTVPSSVLVGASIFGQLPAGTAVLGSIAALQGTNPWIIATASVSGTVGASIVGQLPAGTAVLGSVAALQGTNPWATTNVGSIAVQWQTPSIVGTYAEDSAATDADKGLFVLGVRNDLVASFVSANLDYAPLATDSAGRTLIRPFAAEESRIEGAATTTSGSQLTLVAAAGTGLRNYITDIWLANTGSVATLVTMKDGAGSVLGYTIAPATSGSNLVGLAMPIRTGANATFDIQATTATSTLYATVKGFKAP